VLVDRPIFPRFAFFAVGFALLVVIRGAAWCGDLLARQTSSSRRREQWRGVAVGLVAAAAVVLSVRSLPYGYRYPKQDYPRAVRALEDMIQPGDRVVVVGDPAAIPIQRYLGRAWQRIDTASDLQSVRSEGEPVWVAFTFPSYIQSGQPELWTILRDSCRELAEINGTVAGGSIRIARCP
jgi:hypothetical protein